MNDLVTDTETATFSRLSERLRHARPPFLKMGPVSLFWAIVCGLTCAVMLVEFRGWGFNSQLLSVAGIFAFGGFLATYPAFYIARLLTRGPSAQRMLCFALFSAAGTIILTSAIFAVQYRLYFAQWHADPFSRLWFWQQFFTAGGAVYTYFVLGLRLYLPLGVIGLFVTSWWVNRLAD